MKRPRAKICTIVVLLNFSLKWLQYLFRLVVNTRSTGSQLKRLTAINVEDKTSTILSPIPDWPIETGRFPDIRVVNGRVCTLLLDMRFPVWDPQSGNLVQIFNLLPIPESNRYILTPNFSSEFRIFVKTCKWNQHSSKSGLEFTTFHADQNSGLVTDPSLSFDFNSRTLLRRITPRDILAIEFVHNHLVVVYTKEAPPKMTFFAAVMKKNENNDLGELKIFELVSGVSKVLRYKLNCKITPTHIIISYLQEIFILDFAYWKNKTWKFKFVITWYSPTSLLSKKI